MVGKAEDEMNRIFAEKGKCNVDGAGDRMRKVTH